MTIAITGATGQLGQIVVDKLKAKVPQDQIVAIVRSAQKASDLGVETRVADYNNPETLVEALKGIDTLLLISANEMGKRAQQHHNVIEAAKKTGVKRIVYTSLLHADATTIGLAKEHYATEEMLKSAGIPFTLLRNGWYTENYVGSIRAAIASGRLIGSSGEGKISSASRADYADAAIAVLTSTGHDGKIYELAGDEAWTLSDLAVETSRVTGKDISYVHLPETEYANALASFGVPEEQAHIFAGWDVSTAKGDLFDDSRDLSKLIGRPTTPFSAVVAETVNGTI